MPFQLSPGVLVVEKDLTSIIPAVSTSVGGFAGSFPWGPVMEPLPMTSENELVATFGKPQDGNATSFFTAANFLSYTGNMLVTRADVDGSLNATADGTGLKINNRTDYENQYEMGAGAVGYWAAKYPGALGNSLRVEMADGYSYADWTYAAEFTGAPGTSSYAEANSYPGFTDVDDELHVIVIDEDGAWSGIKGGILEKFAFVSKARDARRADGSNMYYADVVNNQSKYVYWMDHPTGSDINTNSGDSSEWGVTVAEAITGADHKFARTTDVIAASLDGGVTNLAASEGELQAAWDLYQNAEQYDVSLLPCGAVPPSLAKHIIDDIAGVRKDCVAFATATDSAGAMITGVSTAAIVTDTIAFRNDSSFNVNSSYGVLDSAWKYMYDRYNDVYRWVPLNGDTAGLCARTDYTNDPWYSPGGYNRGQYKGVVKLSLVPNRSQRDLLYMAGINPAVTFPGQGTVLFGDKTLLSRPSAFDRINVRRLFIVLEKAIATASKYQLFEFNDSFTRAQFRSMVEPFLRDVQGRRGLYDFRVKCDEVNNTGEIIDRNEFVADIFIKPARSINFITLNFVAARTSVSFDEIGG